MTALGLSGHFFVNQFNAEIVTGFSHLTVNPLSSGLLI